MVASGYESALFDFMNVVIELWWLQKHLCPQFDYNLAIDIKYPLCILYLATKWTVWSP